MLKAAGFTGQKGLHHYLIISPFAALKKVFDSILKNSIRYPDASSMTTLHHGCSHLQLHIESVATFYRRRAAVLAVAA